MVAHDEATSVRHLAYTRRSRKGPYVSAHTSIEGETLAVGVMVVGPTDVTIGTQTKRFEREETFYLPLDDYPAGRYELPILAKGPDGGKTETTVAFFAPHRTAGKPYFLVVGCGGDQETSAELPGSDRPVVRSEVGRTGPCAGKGDVRVRAVTMPGATVTVVGTEKRRPPTPRAEFRSRFRCTSFTSRRAPSRAPKRVSSSSIPSAP